MGVRSQLFVTVLAWAALSAVLARLYVKYCPYSPVNVVSPKLTAWMATLLLPLLGLLDFALYKVGGNAATFSAVMLATRAAQPLTALALTYSTGVMLGHFYLPVVSAELPSGPEVFGRMLVLLSPTFYTMTILSSGDATIGAHRHAIEGAGEVGFAVWMSFWFHVGLAAGRFGLPQHLAPVV